MLRNVVGGNGFCLWIARNVGADKNTEEKKFEILYYSTNDCHLLHILMRELAGWPGW